MTDRFTLQAMRSWFGALLLLLVWLPAQAENLVSVKTGVLPALPAGEQVSRVLTVDGRLVVLTAGGGWLLTPDRKAWSALDWRPADQIVRAAPREHDTLLLLDSTRNDTVDNTARLWLDGATLRLDPLKALPLRLAAAHGAVLGDQFYVSGNSADGQLQLLVLDLKTPGAPWKTLPAWSGPNGEPTSMAAQ
ncbi:MAG TPA: hypothetical protein VFG03_02880, partial [Telluria sp.]|nr:hypothetical protein [Telluria sp.]